jgi:hypothetical protein
MYTEAEAVTKRCCVTGCGAPSPELSPAMVKSKGKTIELFCIGSQCMGWRFNEFMFNGPDSYVSEPGPLGYCGRAGLHVGLE